MVLCKINLLLEYRWKTRLGIICLPKYTHCNRLSCSLFTRKPCPDAKRGQTILWSRIWYLIYILNYVFTSFLDALSCIGPVFMIFMNFENSIGISKDSDPIVRWKRNSSADRIIGPCYLFADLVAGWYIKLNIKLSLEFG